MAKKESVSADGLVELTGKARGLTKKEVDEISKKARGEVSIVGDIKAGVSDFLNGRGSNRTSTPPPPPRKGRSMW